MRHHRYEIAPQLAQLLLSGHRPKQLALDPLALCDIEEEANNMRLAVDFDDVGRNQHRVDCAPAGAKPALDFTHRTIESEIGPELLAVVEIQPYQSWFGEGPELAIVRMLGLFDQPADEKALGALLKAPAIPGLTESLTDLSPTKLRTIVGKLRRARLLAREDPRSPEQLDTHPLVREYFGEQLRTQQTDAWKECNRRLFHYYQTLAPQLPNSFREMEPLFSAVICGCNAGLLREALREVYIPRIQRGNDSFAANVLGARGQLLSVLVHFFEQGRWGSLPETGVEGQSLTAEDQLYILMQAGLYLTATRGMGVPEVRISYERAEPLCHLLGRPLLLNVALVGQWRYTLVTGKMSTAMQIAEQVYFLAQKQHDAALMIGAYRALAATLY